MANRQMVYTNKGPETRLRKVYSSKDRSGEGNSLSNSEYQFFSFITIYLWITWSEASQLNNITFFSPYFSFYSLPVMTKSLPLGRKLLIKKSMKATVNAKVYQREIKAHSDYQPMFLPTI